MKKRRVVATVEMVSDLPLESIRREIRYMTGYGIKVKQIQLNVIQESKGKKK